MNVQILNSKLETQVAIIEAALHDGDNVIIAGNLATGKTTLLKAIHNKLNAKKVNRAAYFSMCVTEAEVKIVKIYTHCTDKILIIDELRTLTSHGLRLEMMSNDIQIVASIQITNSEDFIAVAAKLDLDSYFNKLVYLKNQEGDLEVITLGNELIMLHDYKVKNVPANYGLGKEEIVSEYRYDYNGDSYLVEVVLDIGNIVEVTVFELDDNTKRYVGDTGENVFFVFNTMTVPVKDLQNYVNKWIEEHKKLIFHGDWLLEGEGVKNELN